MEIKEKNIKNFLRHDLKKIATLGIIMLVILAASSLIEKQTNFLSKISELLL